MEFDKLKENYSIRSYEGDQNNNLRLVTLMNILQDAATKDAARRGFGMEFCIKNNMTWVGNDYVIEIKRLPKVDEKIVLQTWPSLAGKLAARRDFEICDEKGESIIKSASRWLLISLDKKRPLSIPDTLQGYTAIDEHVLETDFAKISEPLDDLEYYKYRVRYDDIDINHHINNAVYVLWAGEAVDNAWHKTHTPAKIEVNFKKEGFIGEDIEVVTSMIGDKSTHSIRAKGENARELARAAITWKEL